MIKKIVLFVVSVLGPVLLIAGTFRGCCLWRCK